MVSGVGGNLNISGSGDSSQSPFQVAQAAVQNFVDNLKKAENDGFSTLISNGQINGTGEPEDFQQDFNEVCGAVDVALVNYMNSLPPNAQGPVQSDIERFNTCTDLIDQNLSWLTNNYGDNASTQAYMCAFGLGPQPKDGFPAPQVVNPSLFGDNGVLTNLMDLFNIQPS